MISRINQVKKELQIEIDLLGTEFPLNEVDQNEVEYEIRQAIFNLNKVTKIYKSALNRMANEGNPE